MKPGSSVFRVIRLATIIFALPADCKVNLVANIREAIKLYLETLPPDDRDVLLSRKILTTTVEVNA